MIYDDKSIKIPIASVSGAGILKVHKTLENKDVLAFLGQAFVADFKPSALDKAEEAYIHLVWDNVAANSIEDGLGSLGSGLTMQQCRNVRPDPAGSWVEFFHNVEMFDLTPNPLLLAINISAT